jgi:hypothetical protein
MSRETARVLREALQKRLELVEARLDLPPARRPNVPRAADPEEALRELMVRLWPRVRDGAAGEAERTRYRETLAALWEPAAGGELRFLDAWNNAFETAADELDQPLLAAYADLLRSHVARLNGETTPLESRAHRSE